MDSKIIYRCGEKNFPNLEQFIKTKQSSYVYIIRISSLYKYLYTYSGRFIPHNIYAITMTAALLSKIQI